MSSVAGDLDARAPTDGPAELAALGVSFNRMADALGSSMRAQRDFVANASHQLRTPADRDQASARGDSS